MIPTTCPSCGQPLPAEKVQAAREAFNLAKAKRLEANLADQKAKADKIAKLEAKLERKAVEAMALESTIADMKEQVDESSVALQSLNLIPAPTEAQLNLKALIDDLRAEIAASDDDGSALYAIDMEMVELESHIQAAQEAEARAKAQQEARDRIKELNTEERKVAGEIEQIDQEVFLVESYVRAKVAMLDSRINSLFDPGKVQWKLSEIQQNGALNEICEATIGGVPYNSANHAARIVAGLSIIDVLSEHWNVTWPVWIDEAQSITDIPPTRGQQIRLQVSAKDKKLRLETAA